MSITKWETRPGAYYDSVVLMQLQRGLLALPGIIDSGVVMATPANRELLNANSLLPDSAVASSDDLLIVVKAEADSFATQALEQVDALLARQRSSLPVQDFHPRSLREAVRQLPRAGWVLVSIPGRYAASVAREALELDRHVFLYSDNVTLSDEVELKRTARAKGLLVMGPDCGTAIINGVGLGFANRVRRGTVGLVGASGTGLQAVTSYIHALGGGVSHAIGTGGRDLRSEVGAITAHQSLDLLARDPGTNAIVLISKPPSPEVAAELLAAAQGVGKPVIVCFIGHPIPARRLGNLHFAFSLEDAAQIAVQQSTGAHSPPTDSPASLTGWVRGLFSGGTLAYEALLGLSASLVPIHSNAPITQDQKLADPLRSTAHTIIDLGDEFFMIGRLHPMIDNDLRIRRIKQEAADPTVSLLLLDVVLGEGAHPDPAGELAPVIRESSDRRTNLEVVVVIIGTDSDPQNLDSQVERFEAAGATVFLSLSAAIQHVTARLGHGPAEPGPRVSLDQFEAPLTAINVGLRSFYESLHTQGAQALYVDWRPPASGNEKLAALLGRMQK